MRLKIISGGQTGVDRAALDAALEGGVECGGWCPAGRLDERGVIPAHYPLRELRKGGFKQRTLRNIEDSDGTLIIYFGALEGGTENTLFHCICGKKPYQLIDGSEIAAERAAELAEGLVRTHDIGVLNVAGPRASKSPETYGYALDVVRRLLARCEMGGGDEGRSDGVME
jgi:putative molybdenum carrier protein